MSKYIIDIPDGFEWGVVTCRTEDGFYTRDFDFLEELNSDYINEHFGELQDEAYRKGLEDGKTDNGYQDGVGDAWQTINLIRKMSQHTRETRFGANELGDIMGKYTAKELIAMMRPYFEKPVVPHSDRIEVGDEVIDNDGDATIVTNIHERLFDGLCSDGSTMSDLFLEDVRKTGRHYDHIGKLLEAIRV
jgi:hypothetical protein